LAWSLQRGEDPVVVIDRNATDVRAAEGEGQSVVYGDATQERTLLQADVESRRGLLAVTPNDGLNLFLARRVLELTGTPASWVAVDSRTRSISADQVSHEGPGVLFGREVDIEEWIHRLLHGAACVERWRLQEGKGAELFESLELPIAVERNGSAFPVDGRTTVKKGDVVCLALSGDDEETRYRLRAAGWVPVETDGQYFCSG
jgi:Trk K+ transport system NAD-binding subunit